MRGALLAAAGIVTTLALGGCGSDEPSSQAQGSDTSVTLTFADGEAPTPERVDVAAGEPVEIVVKADEAGELHVHSDPEQELEYDEGTTTLTLTIDEPGVYEVESHDLEQTVLQLEVS